MEGLEIRFLQSCGRGGREGGQGGYVSVPILSFLPSTPPSLPSSLPSSLPYLWGRLCPPPFPLEKGSRCSCFFASDRAGKGASSDDKGRCHHLGREGGASREKREREKKVRNLDRFKGAISFLLDGKEESRRAPGGEEGGREEGCKGGGGREGGH